VRHSPRKRFGQNFLQSRHVIEDILRAINPQADDNMLEIGPGLGALTEPLLRRLNHLTAVEIDTDLQKYWSELPLAQGKLNLIPADALTVDYSQFGAKLRVIGNLPYNISTPLLIHLLHFAPVIEDMHFMLQKEVVERIAAQPGTKDYGRLTVMLQYHCDVDYLFNVPPEAFDPQPKVDSAVVRLVPHRESPFEKVAVEHLERLVASAFAMRRKTLNNNLKGIISAEQLNDLGIDGGKRPEQISVTEYVQLAKFVSN
jgi:16S rRNA (adenine1518-N6/adenine1519-N6)-dimethyltransferase